MANKSLYVPESSVSSYQTADFWKEFYKIKPEANYVPNRFTFDRVVPASGSSFYQYEGLPQVIETYWDNIDVAIKINGNASLLNANGEQIASLSISQSTQNLNLINLSMEAMTLEPGSYTISIPAGVISDESGVWSNEQVSWSYSITDDPIYLFDSVSPADGSTFYKTQGLPTQIETVWKNIDSSVKFNGNPLLLNANGEQIASLNIAQSTQNLNLISLTMEAMTLEPGSYTISIPAGSISDESGAWSNEQVSWSYSLTDDPIFLFDSVSPADGSTFYKTQGLPSQIETVWKNIDSSVKFNGNPLLLNANGEQIASLSIAQSTQNLNLISLTMEAMTLDPGSYTINIPAGAISDQSGVWSNEQVSWSYSITDDPIYLFDSVSPADGSTFYKTQGLPTQIETVWKNIDSSVKFNGNPLLLNANGEQIASLSIAQSTQNLNLISLTMEAMSLDPGSYTIRIPEGVITDESGVWSNEQVSWSYSITDDPIFLFDSVSPADGSTFYKTQGLPTQIETVWKNIDSSVKFNGNPLLLNANGDRIASFDPAQSTLNRNLISLSMDAIALEPGTYTILIPKGIFSDESGIWSNEQVSWSYEIVDDPIYLFESVIPEAGTAFSETAGLPDVFETYWKNIDAKIVVRNSPRISSTTSSLMFGVYVSQDPDNLSHIDLIPQKETLEPGTYTLNIPQKSFTDESGVWYNEEVSIEYVILPNEKLTAPIISFNGRAIVISAEDDSEVFYSIDNSNFTKYIGEFNVTGLVTISAYSHKDGDTYVDSDTTTYQITSYGSDLYAELGEGGSLDEAYQWADETTRSSILANPNFLVFAANSATAAGVTDRVANVVVGDKAERITLSDAGGWHSPREFEAQEVSFSRTFSKQTAIDGGCAGWETIALPFAVQTVTHANGELYPFAASSDANAHRFWLYKPDSYEWQAAAEIEANVPYLIAMPNNPAYYEAFNITGEVTFAASNAVIPATPADLSYDYRDGYKISANYLNRPADSRLLVVNDVATDGHEPGSCFVADERAVKPFEAYLTAPGQNRVPIFSTTSLTDGLMTEMALRVWADTPQSVSVFAPCDATVKVYDISGRAVRTVKIAGGTTERIADLPAGIYIIAKTKVAIIR